MVVGHEHRVMIIKACRTRIPILIFDSHSRLFTMIPKLSFSTICKFPHGTAIEPTKSITQSANDELIIELQ